MGNILKKSKKAKEPRTLSTIKFYRNVPLNPNLADTMLFDSEEEQEKWFSTYEVPSLELETSYQRTEYAIRTPYKYEDLQDINYVKVINPSYPGSDLDEVTYWGFVNNTAYINDGLTVVDWMCDPLMTFMFRWRIPQTFIERRMLSIVTGDENNPQLHEDRRNLLLEPEPVGAYTINQPLDSKNIYNDSDGYMPSMTFFVIIVSSGGENTKTVSFVGSPAELSYYFVPFYDNTGELWKTVLTNKNNGTQEINTTGITTMQQLLGNITEDSARFGGGTNIVNAYYTKQMGIDFKVDTGNRTFIGEIPDDGAYGTASLITSEDINGTQMFKVSVLQQGYPSFPKVNITSNSGYIKHGSLKDTKYNNFRTILTNGLTYGSISVRDRINSLQGEYGLEKLATSPYSTIVLTDMAGGDVKYNLAEFTNQDQPFSASVRGFLSKSTKTQIFLTDYQKTYNMSDPSEKNRTSLWDANSKALDITVDSYKVYEYLNQNRIKQSYDNAKINLQNNQIQQNASRNNFKLGQDLQVQQLSMTQANEKGVMASNQQFGIAQQVRANDFNLNYNNSRFQMGLAATGVQSAVGAIGGLISGSGSGGLGNAVGKFGSSAVQQSADFLINQNLLGQQQGFNLGQQQLANQQDQNVLGMNQALAQQMLGVGQGNANQQFLNSMNAATSIMNNNYHNALANINAGLRDIQLQPGSAAVTGNDFDLEYAYSYDGYHIQYYTQTPQVLVRIAEYFAQFGYAYNRLGDVEACLRVRSKFNYVKTNNAKFYGNFANHWRDTLAAIFNNGVRFWRDSQAMIDYDITGNTVVPGGKW